MCKINPVTRVQIVHEIVCVSLYANALKKNRKSCLHIPAIGSADWGLSPCYTTSLGEEKLWI